MASTGDDGRELRATLVDGTQALFGLVIRPAADDGRVTVETFGSGMSKEEAALMLRDIAAAMEAELL